MKRGLFCLVAVFLCVLAARGPADAQENRRVALVIGNSTYANAPALANPQRDADLVAQALRTAGFTTVHVRQDLALQPLLAALRDFAAEARGADMAFVYFAGHGLNVGGQNWIAPVDARFAADTDVEYEAVRFEAVARALEGARVRVLMLDACRNSPFIGGMRRLSATGGPAAGLARVEVDDILVMYAAAEGATAADGAGRNSPFATAVAQRLPERGLELRLMAGRIRDDVIAATSGAQRPFVSANLSGDAYFIVPGAGVSAAPRKQEPGAHELAVWNGALLAGTKTAFEGYLREFPSGRYGALARDNLRRLESAERASAPRPAGPAPIVINVSDRSLRPGATFRDCDVCPPMVVVPAGVFRMGSPASDVFREADEGPQQDVRIRAFAVGQFEVTQGLYRAYLKANGRPADFDLPNDDDVPKRRLSWQAAVDYTLWLSRVTGQSYRLLTEAEWEYVNRAGSTERYPTGRFLSNEDAHFSGTSTIDGSPSGAAVTLPVKVGSYPANRFGVHDMVGNVREWVQDCYEPRLSPALRDGRAVDAENCRARVVRGENYIAPAFMHRSSRRLNYAPRTQDFYTGFRVARELR